jgi:hypothetical protein
LYILIFTRSDIRQDDKSSDLNASAHYQNSICF